jgi:hypothetical protein
MGPTSMLRGSTADNHKEFAASVTLRYSDAPNDSKQTVLSQKNNEKQEIQAECAEESSYLKFRI